MRVMIVLLAVLLSVVNAPVHAQQQPICDSSLPPRLVPGQQGQVTPGDANRLRALPTTAAEAVGTIPGGEQFTVIHGPTCADGFTWWYVNYADSFGWTVEGNDGTYWLEPLGEGDTPLMLASPMKITSVNYNGVAMLVPQEMASGAEGSLVPASEILPAHTEFTITDYVATGEPTLRFYRATEYEQVTGVALNALTDESIPSAERVVLHDTAIMPAHFVNGSVSAVGVQYVTWDVPAGRALEDGDLTYVITALIETSEIFIHAEYPLHSAFLPPSASNLIIDDASYAEGVAAMLMNASADAFFPSPSNIRLNLTRAEPGFPLMVAGYGVSFTHNSVLSTDEVVAEYVPASDFAPEHIAFELGTRTMFGAGSKIAVYSAADYEESLGVDLTPLRDTLANRSADPDTTIGPRLRANRPFIGQAEYVDFQNGTGVRYVAHYTLDTFPEINPLLYVFAGLTDDGDWLILAYIETGADLYLFDQPGVSEITDQDAYLEVGNRLLAELDSGDFNPALDLLDQVTSSLLVEPHFED